MQKHKSYPSERSKQTHQYDANGASQQIRASSGLVLLAEVKNISSILKERGKNEKFRGTMPLFTWGKKEPVLVILI